MRRVSVLGLVLALLAPGLLRAEPTSVGLDRVVAFVEDEPILASEVRAAIDLCLVRPEPGEDTDAFARRALESLVDERLRARDVERFGEPAVARTEVDQALATIAADCGRDAAAQVVRAEELGFDAVRYRNLVRRQIAVKRSAEERFGAAVFVSDEEIEEAWADDPEIHERLATSGVVQPPELTPELRELVRTLLAERQRQRLIDEWMASLRAAARIERIEPAD